MPNERRPFFELPLQSPRHLAGHRDLVVSLTKERSMKAVRMIVLASFIGLPMGAAVAQHGGGKGPGAGPGMGPGPVPMGAGPVASAPGMGMGMGMGPGSGRPR